MHFQFYFFINFQFSMYWPKPYLIIIYISNQKYNNLCQGTQLQLAEIINQLQNIQQNCFGLNKLMNYDSIDDNQINLIEKELLMMPGPCLADIFVQNNQPEIVPFTSASLITSIQGQKDILYIGNQDIDILRAFNYILLRIGLQQKKNYPHLYTHIKEQFYRPNMFISQGQTAQNNQIMSVYLQVCQKYFQQVKQVQKVEKFFSQNSLFQTACLLMLKKITQESIRKQPEFNKLILILCRKFHIDVREPDLNTCDFMFNKCQIYIIGSEERFLLIKECIYVFIVIVGESVDSQNEYDDDKLQSDRSGESGLQNVIQVSQESTPKFKDSEAAKYRRKSHKNSFGGDLDVVNYRDLQNPGKNYRLNNKKVLSQHFQVQQMGSLCYDKVDQQVILPSTKNDEVDNKRNLRKKLSIQMKNSSIQHQAQNSQDQQVLESPKLRHFISNTSKKSNNRQRKIASSQIIQFKQFDNIMSFSKHDKQRIILQQNIEKQLDAELSRNTSQKSIGQNQKYLQSRATHLKGSILIPNAQLQRIQERQSSQRQSTHPDNTTSQSNQLTSDAIIDLLQSSIQKNLKDRKYSYFTQQMATSKSRKSKQKITDIKLNKKGKNAHLHKNSQVINGFGKRRFQQNPLRFSQLGNQISGIQADQIKANSNSQFSVLSNSGNRNPYTQLIQKQKKNKNKLMSNVISFVNNRHCPNQPVGWIKKQTIFYFNNKRPEKLLVQKIRKNSNINLGSQQSYGDPKQKLKTEQVQNNLFGNNSKSNKSLDYQRKNSYQPQTTMTEAPPRLSKKNSNSKKNNQLTMIQNKDIEKSNGSQIQSVKPKSQTSLNYPNDQNLRNLYYEPNSSYRPVSQMNYINSYHQPNSYNQPIYSNNQSISSYSTIPFRKQSYDTIQTENRSMKNVFLINTNQNQKKLSSQVNPFSMIKNEKKVQYNNNFQNPQKIEQPFIKEKQKIVNAQQYQRIFKVQRPNTSFIQPVNSRPFEIIPQRISTFTNSNFQPQKQIPRQTKYLQVNINQGQRIIQNTSNESPIKQNFSYSNIKKPTINQSNQSFFPVFQSASKQFSRPFSQYNPGNNQLNTYSNPYRGF